MEDGVVWFFKKKHLLKKKHFIMKTKYIVCFKTLKIIPIVKLILYSMLKDSTLDSNLTFIFLVYTAKMNLLKWNYC